MYTDFEPENRVKQSYNLAVRHFLKYNRLILWRNTMENIEIERKFLIKEIPDNLDTYEKIDMTQGYLNTSRLPSKYYESSDALNF